MSKSQRNKSQTGRDPVKTSKSPHLQKKDPKTRVEMETGRITRSSPKTSSAPPCLYDFIGESPVMDSIKNSNKRPTQSKTVAKNVKKKTDKAKIKDRPTADVKRKSKEGSKKTADLAKSTVTPKGRVSRSIVTLDTFNSDKETKKGDKRLRALKPIPPPNLDDISPIVRVRKSTTPSRKRAANSKSNGIDSVEKKKLRSSKGGEIPVAVSVSFVESDERVTSDDSAIFVSPRQTMPRFDAGKTSTPADVPTKRAKTASKKLSKLTVKDTSTPIESRPKRDFTGIKDNISKLSPVHRMDTPTSDYGSMEIIPTPSPTPAVKGNRKKRSNSPAFTLEDDDSGDNLNLNKSVDRSYKKSHSKRKYDTTGRFSTSKLDEWADKVNSELEDIENFELSVEG